MNRKALAAEIEESFWTELIECWFSACMDASGGFHQNLSRDWRPSPSTQRFVVFQSRMTWVAATIAEFRPQFSAVALHGLQSVERFIEDDGSVHWMIDSEGRPTTEFKHIYGASFAMYALAAVARTTGSRKALDLGLHVFGWLERRLHDSVHGGYFEFTDLAGNRVGGPQEKSDAIGTPYGMKSQNSHLHLLESFAELARVSNDPLLRQRLIEVVDVVQNRLLDENGNLHGVALADWTPQPFQVSYGHNIEAVHLLMTARDVLGPGAPNVNEAALALTRHTMREGLDRLEGGVFASGKAEGPDDLSKVWWVQAEALLGFARALELPGAPVEEIEAALQSTWAWIRSKQIDSEHGGWFDTIADGRVVGDGRKAHAWKAAYHDGRALLCTARALKATRADAP